MTRDIVPSDRKARFFGALRVRAISVLLAVLIPAMAVALSIAYYARGNAVEKELADIAQRAEMVDLRLETAWLGATRIANLFAGIASRGAISQATCTANLNDTLSTLQGYDDVALIKDGAIACRATLPGTVEDATFVAGLPIADISKQRTWRGFAGAGADRQFAVSALMGSSADELIIAVVTIQSRFVAELLGAYRSVPSGVAYIADRNGHMIVPGKPTARESYGDIANLPLKPTPQIVTLPGPGEEPYVFTTRKLNEFDAWLVTAQREAEVLAPAYSQFWHAAGRLVFVFCATLLGIWVGLTRIVLRWIQHISHATESYARGNHGARAGPCPGAPTEIAVLARNFDDLSDRMEERATELEHEVVQRGRHVRELHHHVKNTLQIAASLLALQVRSAPANIRTALRFPEDRMNAMAAAYATFYNESELDRLPVGRLVTEVVYRLCQSRPGSRCIPQFDLGDAPGTIDLVTANTLAMLLAEVLPPMLDESARTGLPIAVRVTLMLDRWKILIDGPSPPEFVRDSLSIRILNAHLRRLDGQLNEAEPGHIVLDLQRAEAAD